MIYRHKAQQERKIHRQGFSKQFSEPKTTQKPSNYIKLNLSKDILLLRVYKHNRIQLVLKYYIISSKYNIFDLFESLLDIYNKRAFSSSINFENI